MKKTAILLLIILSFVNVQIAQSFEDSLKIEITKHSTPEEQVDFLNNYSSHLRSISRLDDAIVVSKQAVEIVIKNNLEEKYSKTYSFLGLNYRNNSNYLDAQKCFQKAIDVAKKLDQKTQIAWGYNNLATIDRILSNYSDAIEKIYSSLSIFKDIGHKKGESHCHVNLGILFRYQRKLNKSLEHLNIAVGIREEMQDLNGLAQVKYLIAETYFMSGEYNKALEYYKISEKIYDDQNNNTDFVRSSLYMAFGGTYYALNQYEKALEYRLKALKINLKAGEKNNLARIFLAIGRIYIKLENYPLAEKNLEKALNYALDISLKSRLLEIKQTMADLYFQWNKPKIAYKFLKQYSEFKDSIFTSESKEQIAKLEAEFNTKEKEKENELLSTKLEFESQKSFFLFVMSLLSAASIFLFFILYKNTRKNNQLLKGINDTKDKLFSIISHDIKNPFGLIMNTSDLLIKEKTILEQNEKEELIENINSSSKKVFTLLDNLLNWSKSQRGLIKINKDKFKLKELVDKTIELLIYESALKRVQ